MPIKSAKFALFLMHTMHSIKKRVQNYYFFFTYASAGAIFFLPHRTLGLNLTKFAVSRTSDACFFEKNEKKFAHITKKH